MPKSLKTPPSVWTQVFRRIVRQLESDPEIRRVVGVDNVRSWKGVPGDKDPFEPSGGRPVLRLTPHATDVDWYSPDAQRGRLIVAVELALESLAIDDVNDLYDLVVQALRPGAAALVQDLVAAGAETGEIVFSDPAYDPKPDAAPEGRFFAFGSFALSVIRTVNP